MLAPPLTVRTAELMLSSAAWRYGEVLHCWLVLICPVDSYCLQTVGFQPEREICRNYIEPQRTALPTNTPSTDNKYTAISQILQFTVYFQE